MLPLNTKLAKLGLNRFKFLAKSDLFEQFASDVDDISWKTVEIWQNKTEDIVKNDISIRERRQLLFYEL